MMYTKVDSGSLTSRNCRDGMDYVYISDYEKLEAKIEKLEGFRLTVEYLVNNHIVTGEGYGLLLKALEEMNHE